MRVRILGAGVAGLACALAMRRRGGFHDVRVLERDTPEEAATRAGHGMILMPNGVAALRALGVDRYLDQFRPLEKALVQDHTGMVIWSEEMTGVYGVTRTGILDALRAEVGPDGIEYGREVSSVDVADLPSGGGSRIARSVRSIHFQAGEALTSADADLFVGADGWRSPMFAALNPGVTRELSPVFEIVTTTRLPDLAVQLGSTFLKTEFNGQGLAFGLLSPAPDHVIGFLQFDRRRHGCPAQTTDDDLRQFVTRLVGDAPEPVASYLAQADFSTGHLWRPTDSDVTGNVCGSNAVTIGDAAHPLLPFTSQGGSLALEDAVILADVMGLVREEPRLLPLTLAGFARDRAGDLAAYVTGGRRILSRFLAKAAEPAASYLGGSVSGFTEHQSLPLTDLRSLFGLFDCDGDGHLSRHDFGQLLDRILDDSIGAHDAKALFDEIDADHDDLIGRSEWSDAVRSGREVSPALWKLRESLTPRRVATAALTHRLGLAFRAADHDGDSLIGLDDFATVLPMFGVVADRPACQNLFDAVDTQASGRISQDQLLAAVKRARIRSVHTGDELFGDDRVNLSVLRERSYNHRWAAHPPDVIPLTAADCDFPVCDEIIAAVQRYLSDRYVPYGPPEGLPQFRQVAADLLQAERGLACTPETLLPTDGAASAMYLIGKHVITDIGDEAIVPDPADFLLERSVRARGGVVKRWAASDGRFDPAELESLITPRTRLISLCNPHNPLGRVFRRHELEEIASVAVRHDLWILSDEVWSDIVFPPHQHCSIASIDPAVAAKTFTVLGFSKSYGLAGMRLGLIVTPDRDRRDQLMATAHAYDTAYGASTVSQVAGAAAYERGQTWLTRFVAHLQRQRDYAVARLNAMEGVQCQAPEGTFVAFPDISSLQVDQDAFADRLLMHHRLAVVPGSPRWFGPGAAGHVRLSFATSREILADGLDRFEQGVHALTDTSAL